MNTQINRGVAALKEGAQSLWYPYVHSKNGPKNGENRSVEGTKFTTNYHNGRLKNGELVLAVARQVMLDYHATVESLSALLEVSESSVKKALKKLRDKISAGLAIPGLNDRSHLL